MQSKKRYLLITSAIFFTLISSVAHSSDRVAPCQDAIGNVGLCKNSGSSEVVLVDKKFAWIGYGDISTAYPARLSKDSKVGFINSAGQWIIEPQFDIANPFSIEDRIATVAKGDQSAAVDLTGKVVIPWTKAAIGPFSEGLAAFVPYVVANRSEMANSKMGFIDNTGKLAIAAQFDGVDELGLAMTVWRNGLIPVGFNGLRGLINRSGDWVLKPEFTSVVATVDLFKKSKNTDIQVRKIEEDGSLVYTGADYVGVLTQNGQWLEPLHRSGASHDYVKDGMLTRALFPKWQRDSAQSIGMGWKLAMLLSLLSFVAALVAMGGAWAYGGRKRWAVPTKTIIAIASCGLTYVGCFYFGVVTYAIVMVCIVLGMVLFFIPGAFNIATSTQRDMGR